MRPDYYFQPVSSVTGFFVPFACQFLPKRPNRNLAWETG
ncbi:hypothetical protein TRICHSKD4_1867 [Roseibium sp. TrichSKD4]|nr:hypothetical protein TRICHSKD4_1867 [Roseibium sp. TrichSKD4]